ncbi:PDZ domain-containing protein [Ectobacillus polymachus]|uniref:PDZ domain-containing protein n=1 Tax=Ectobacillus polymachus TaxID=1508806 RepID=UPI003A88FB0C
MESWLFEILQGIEKFFLNPVLYIIILSNLLVGYWRVRQERKQFSFKIYNPSFEIRTTLFTGFAIGMSLSVLFVGIGLVVSKVSLVLIGLWSILFAVTLQYRYLSPAYSVGIAMVLLLFPSLPKTIGSFAPFIADTTGTYLPCLAVLLALLLFTEGYLILKSAMRSTPRLVKGKRGLWIGMHVCKRLWVVPVFMLIPGDGLQSMFSWWPVISIDSHTFSLILVPFAIGFSKRMRGNLPSLAITYTGRRIQLLSFIVLALAITSFFLPGIALAAAGIAILGRVTITIRERIEDEKQPPYFSITKDGLMILDILPDSVGVEMGLKSGEIITKVNGTNPTSLGEFYSALQRNTAGAFCKMEVIDTNGELRFVQHAMFEGDHHELGILFVQREPDWDSEVG